MLEDAGCKVLTIHGRTRDQRGPLTGLADWSYVKAVRKAVKIPVISNGNIQCMEDLNRCLDETGAVGVMTAEGNLYNPALFAHMNPPAWEPALEYLDLVETYPCPNAYIRGHLFKLFHNLYFINKAFNFLNKKINFRLSLPTNNNLRMELGSANTMGEFRRIVNVLKSTYEHFHLGINSWAETTEKNSENLVLPPWLCQSYVRMDPEEHLRKVEENVNM